MHKILHNPLSWIILSVGLIVFAIFYEGLVAVPGIILLIAGIGLMGIQQSVHIWQFTLTSVALFMLLILIAGYLLRDAEDWGVGYALFLVLVIINALFIVTRLATITIMHTRAKNS
jgi:uncharacterized membrane protein (UPF0136 family)